MGDLVPELVQGCEAREAPAQLSGDATLEELPSGRRLPSGDVLVVEPGQLCLKAGVLHLEKGVHLLRSAQPLDDVVQVGFDEEGCKNKDDGAIGDLRLPVSTSDAAEGLPTRSYEQRSVNASFWHWGPLRARAGD